MSKDAWLFAFLYCLKNKHKKNYGKAWNSQKVSYFKGLNNFTHDYIRKTRRTGG